MRKPENPKKKKPDPPKRKDRPRELADWQKALKKKFDELQKGK